MTRRNIHDVVADARSEIEELTVEQLQAEMEAGTCLVIDIRDMRERIKLGVIPGAVSAPRGMLEFWFDPESPYHDEKYSDFDGRYVLHCAAGWRSAIAAKAIQELGFTNVAHLEPGFAGWTAADAPVEDISETSSWMRRPRD